VTIMPSDTTEWTTMKYQIKSRWPGSVVFEAEIECSADASEGIKLGLAVRAAYKSGAVLSGAYLSGADLSECPVKIEGIHQKVYAAASVPDALDMGDWHVCDTTHCRAGWVVHLAGEAGRALELMMGTPAAAAMIYMASDPTLEQVPDFYCSNEEALADMKRLAEAEASAVTP
jgi:hypothetical protein